MQKKHVEISLFSQLRLSVGGEPRAIGSRKARELLALLLVYRGGPIKKLWAAETLWPQVDQPQALDSLYKVLRFWRSNETLRTYLPLKIRLGELELETRDIECDAWSFETESEDPAHMEAAAERYTGPLLFHEYYEWTAEREAFYELRYLRLLDALADLRHDEGDEAGAAYYRKKRDLLYG